MKHVSNKAKLNQKRELDLGIAKALTKYQSQVHPKGETLPESIRVYRVKVVRALLGAGIPIQKADVLRELLEEAGYPLTDSSHLRELLPYILQQETSRLKEEVRGKHLSIIFDGTTHVCEALVVIIRYMEKWVIKQQICWLMLLVKSLTGEELSRQLITVISKSCHI